ncbi:hypothetical protein SAMN05216561_12613 [Nocardioides psychrotolerans]|uniref:Uncharacterized protein n=1 Tax=Nocardioides psychrotolerans TaxID=1005945 RepID=A0A1I3QK67_9ACTN|nr:hypothetical protein SAMN05216561_12613 [Nocardioides psychrotolerans]
MLFLLRVLLWGGYTTPRLARHRAASVRFFDEQAGPER